MYVSIFVDFFRQIMEFTKEFSDAPLFKIWIGPLPLLVLFHAETVEVRSLTVTVCTQCSLCKLSMPTRLAHLSSMQRLQHIVTRSEKCSISFSVKKGNSRLKYFHRQMYFQTVWIDRDLLFSVSQHCSVSFHFNC